MKALMMLLMILILGGCASSPGVPIPEWDIDEKDIINPVDPEPLPGLCNIPWTAGECWRAISEYELVAEANTGIAQANTAALRDMQGAYLSLAGAGKLQQQYAQLREQQLADEKRDHFLDNWFYRVIIVGGAALVIATQ